MIGSAHPRTRGRFTALTPDTSADHTGRGRAPAHSRSHRPSGRGRARLLLFGLAVLTLWPPQIHAQAEEPASIYARVRDGDGAALVAVFAALRVADSIVRVADSDRLGFFGFQSLTAGSYVLELARLGYHTSQLEFTLRPGQELNVDVVLEPAPIAIEGIEVEASQSRQRSRFVRNAGATIREISIEQILDVPGVAEADPIRAIQVLPGVVSTSDLSATFHVRGGSSDQNLILLDGVPVFSPFHLGGFFSVFSPDIVDRVQLQSGGFPAEHGGRVSSVLTVETDPGNGEFEVEGAVSLLAARAALSGGLSQAWRERLGLSSLRWRGAARRSYFDVLLKPAFDFPYHLTDLQGTLEAWTLGGNRIEVTAYHGRDILDFRDSDSSFPLKVQWDWGNDVVGVRWTWLLRRGGSVSMESSFSRFGSGLGFPDFDDTDLRTEIEQFRVGTALDLPIDGSAGIRLGVQADRLSYDNHFATGGTVFADGRGAGWLLAAYGQVSWRRGAWLVEPGLRFDGWQPDPGDPVLGVSPRLGLKHFIRDDQWALKLSLGNYTQFLHSIRDEELPIGLDVWVLAGDRAPHVRSDQFQLGIEGYFREGWEASLEGYYRSFDGVTALNTADDPNDELDDIVAGEGISYGADLMVRKDAGDVTGWITLSLLWADRSFEDLLSPLRPRPTITYAPIFDRRLDLDLVLQLPFWGGWDAGLRWNVGTGIPYTRAVGGFAFYRSRFAGEEGRLEWVGAEGVNEPLSEFAVLLGHRNGERYPTYHRLDLSFRKLYEKSWGTITPNLSVLNLYNRKNVLFYFFNYDRSPPTRTGVSMFPLLPTIGVEVTF